MVVNWKNAPFILILLTGIVGYVIRFEVLASSVRDNEQKISLLEKGMKILVARECKEAIEEAEKPEDKKKAYDKCKPFMEEG